MFSAIRAAIDLVPAPAMAISIMTDIMEVEANSGGEDSHITEYATPPEVGRTGGVV